MAKRYTYHVKVFRRWGSGIASKVPKKLNARQTQKCYKTPDTSRYRLQKQAEFV